MKTNRVLNQQNPQFKAKFANTIETKRALKQLSEKSPRDVFVAIETLKKALPNDIITVARRGVSNFDIMNTTALKNSQELGYKFFQTCSNPADFVKSLLNIGLSNGKKIMDYQDQGSNKLFEKLEKDSQSNETKKEIDIISSQIERLIARRNQLKEQFAEQEKDYVKNIIDSL